LPEQLSNIEVRAVRSARLDGAMTRELIHPPKARRGDQIAVLSPSFAAAGAFPELHEQAMRRLAEVTGLVPVEYPTTRKVGASPRDRAADVSAAFADPQIRGILAVIGGDDQVTVIPHLDPALARRDPKPFLGSSDNTHLHHWLWASGVASFYGGSSQVHLGPGPGVDEIHERSLRAALLTGETLEITDPGGSEDVGVDWHDPRSLESFGDREPTEPWARYGPARTVTGPSWGGCLEVIQEVPRAGAGPPAGRAARHRRGNGRALQPGSCALRRCAIRPHPAAVDPPARRHHHRRRRQPPDHRRLPLAPGLIGTQVSHIC
jgi:hypothetical protein